MKALLTFLALLSLASADDYYLLEPDSEVYTDLRQSFTIVADHAVDIGDIKPHPKIIWLDRSIARTNDATMHTELGFVVRAPGLIKFPPIPVVIENKSFFLRLDDIQALKNPAPKDLGQLDIYWNKEREKPHEIHLGEAIEIDFVAKLPMRQLQGRSYPLFSRIPLTAAKNASWYLFSRQPGRNARPDDFFYNFRHTFYPQRYQTSTGEIDGKAANQRRYQARLICSELGEVSGHLGMTFGLGQFARTHLIPYKFDVVPLPPPPNERLINTGLVGNWTITSSISPSVLSANRPLEIRLDIQGRGNPNLRNDFDFSREGFSSVDSKLTDLSGMNYDVWNGRFIQTLVPSGNIATFPAATLASFDTVNDRWKLHPVNPAMTLQGLVDATQNLSPVASLGKAVTRPILLNLPSATFPIVALAPFLPFLLGFLKKRLDKRDPVRKARQQKLRALIASFRSGNSAAEAIDDDLLPLLREHLELPSGASTGEVASALEEKHEDLAGLLRDHSKASFSSGGSGIDLKSLATQLAKLSFLFLLIGQLRGTTLEEANLAFSKSRFTDAISQYEQLIEETPGQPRLYQNLAITYLAVDDAARARAVCHTALLLSPLDPELRTLMDGIRKRVGEPALPGTSLLALRPDQWFILAAILWIIGFLLVGLRHFPHLKIPRWITYLVFALALLFIGTGAWRNAHAYGESQFMVIGDEVPREPEAGIPDWEFPTLKSGQIVQVSETKATHALVSTDETSFWIPLSQLKQVW
jgi:tetratricopeptide (TPR) repeat protein